MAAQMRALTFLAVLVAAMAVVFAEETASFARLAPEGEHQALGDAKDKVAAAAEAKASKAEAAVAKKAGDVIAAKSAVDRATKSLSKADVENAYRNTAKAAGAPTNLVKDTKASMAADAKAKAKAAAAKAGSREDVERALEAAKNAHKRAEE